MSTIADQCTCWKGEYEACSFCLRENFEPWPKPYKRYEKFKPYKRYEKLTEGLRTMGKNCRKHYWYADSSGTCPDCKVEQTIITDLPLKEQGTAAILKQVKDLETERDTLSKDYATTLAILADFVQIAEKHEDAVKILAGIKPNEPQTIGEWMEESHRVAKEKGWHSPSKSFPEELLLMHSELSETIEEFRKEKGMNEVYYENGKPEGIPIELADVVIRIMDTCQARGIDLQKAMVIKNDYNKTRPIRHGGKKI